MNPAATATAIATIANITKRKSIDESITKNIERAVGMIETKSLVVKNTIRTTIHRHIHQQTTADRNGGKSLTKDPKMKRGIHL